MWLLAGLVLILAGANWLTDGSAALARRFGLSELIIGLTVVAMGTSTPELVISVMSAMEGSSALALGNVVGSNIFNVLVIVGVVALMRPIGITRSVMQTQLPLTVATAALMLVMLWLGGDTLTRPCGWALVALFGLYMAYTVVDARRNAAPDDPAAGRDTSARDMPLWRSLLWIALGLAGLIYGGDRFVAGASGLAQALGVGEAVVGITVVAMGTSLPELATSVVAARKNRPGLVVGNIIGSCIFNILLVLGAAASIFPLELGGVTWVDLWVMTGSTVIFWWTARWGGGSRVITRAEGALMLALYCGYTAWLVARAV